MSSTQAALSSSPPTVVSSTGALTVIGITQLMSSQGPSTIARSMGQPSSYAQTPAQRTASRVGTSTSFMSAKHTGLFYCVSPSKSLVAELYLLHVL